MPLTDRGVSTAGFTPDGSRGVRGFDPASVGRGVPLILNPLGLHRSVDALEVGILNVLL